MTLLQRGVPFMSRIKRFPPLFITFLVLMGLLIVIGMFLMIWGSLHYAAPLPTLQGPGLFARVTLHA